MECAFEKQVRHVCSGVPIVWHGEAIHMMQIVVSYANYFVELIEIFPPSDSGSEGKVKPFNIERQFIHCYS